MAIKNWEGVVADAKRELGYKQNERLSPGQWGRVIDCAKILWNRQKKEYREYFKSKKWDVVRETVLARDNHTCEDCGVKATQVHHETYERLGKEFEEDDCVSLCKFCHKARHGLVPRRNIPTKTPDEMKARLCKIYQLSAAELDRQIFSEKQKLGYSANLMSEEGILYAVENRLKQLRNAHIKFN